jgi:hypothetical protein
LASCDFSKTGPAESGIIAIVSKLTNISVAVDFIRFLLGQIGMTRSQPAIVWAWKEWEKRCQI